jgi:hypothetical protein
MRRHMQIKLISARAGAGFAMSVVTAAILYGCGGEGSKVKADPQTISFSVPATPPTDQATITVIATASSGLPVRFTSLTPAICSVGGSTGVVTGLASGVCTIAADQSGNSQYAPAPQVTQNITFTFSHTLVFAPAPSLSLYDRGTVTAVDSSGLPVAYASDSLTVCSVSAGTGLVTALATGNCVIAATAGTLQATQTITVSAPATITVPGAPTGVNVTAGDTVNSVKVSIGGTVSGGSPISGYTVASIPAGITVTGSASPVTVNCTTSCAGYGFTVTATNGIGTSPASAVADVITGYSIVETFLEPDTQPNNSIFIGTFTLNSTTGTVSNLRGILSESMTGGTTPYPNDTMTWLTLNNQLSSVFDQAAGGLLVTTFLLNVTNTLSTLGGGDGWCPGTGFGLHYGFPGGANPGNAYARIFVNVADPTAPLTQTQIDKLAYADCAPGGMMGSTCMTGTTIAGYGTVGTMSGFPISQVITRLP